MDLLRVGFFGVASLRQFDDAVALLATFSRRFVPRVGCLDLIDYDRLPYSGTHGRTIRPALLVLLMDRWYNR